MTPLCVPDPADATPVRQGNQNEMVLRKGERARGKQRKEKRKRMNREETEKA